MDKEKTRLLSGMALFFVMGVMGNVVWTEYMM